MYMNERTRIRKIYKIIADGVEVAVHHNANTAMKQVRDLQDEGRHHKVRIVNDYVAARP